MYERNGVREVKCIMLYVCMNAWRVSWCEVVLLMMVMMMVVVLLLVMGAEWKSDGFDDGLDLMQ